MTSQISARISDSTKAELDRLSRAHGLKKGHVIEQALLHYMQSLAELPPDAIVPPRIVLSEEGFERVSERLDNPKPPTAALVELMGGD